MPNMHDYSFENIIWNGPPDGTRFCVLARVDQRYKTQIINTRLYLVP